MAGKLSAVVRVRMTGDMFDALHILADLDDRRYEEQIRHLLKLGFHQELERLRAVKVPRRDALAIKALSKLLGDDV